MCEMPRVLYCDRRLLTTYTTKLLIWASCIVHTYEHSFCTLCKRADIIIPKLLSVYQRICRVHLIITEIIMSANECMYK